MVIINDIKENDVADYINFFVESNRLKGHFRQVEIIKFLAIWKFATQRQLAYLTGENENNVVKHIKRLKEFGYIEVHKYRSYRIIEITKRGLELIEDLTGIEYEFLKTKEKWKKENVEHDLIIRAKAIQMISNTQYPVKTSYYFKKIYKKLCWNIEYKKQVDRQIRKIHIADFIIIQTDIHGNDVKEIIGVEYENTHKKVKDIRKKLKSMRESVGYYTQYLFIPRNKNIMASLISKIYRISKQEYIKQLIDITNLPNTDIETLAGANEINYSAIPEKIALESAKELLKDMKKLRDLKTIPNLRRRLS